MSQKAKQIRIQQKVDTQENWKNNNPVLFDKEIGYERETGKYKIGDGETEWNNLPYHSIGNQGVTIEQFNTKVDKIEGKQLSTNDFTNEYKNKVDNTEDLINEKVADLVGSAPETLDTLEELSKALQEHEDAYGALLEVVGNKIDKVDGKDLSSNDFTDGDKEKLSNLSNVGREYIIDGEPKGEIFGDYENNKAITKNSFAQGTRTIAGCRGYYYSDISIDTQTKTLTITLTQSHNEEPTTEWEEGLQTGWSVGDKISIIDDTKKCHDCATITNINANIITATANPLPFDTFTWKYDDGFDGNTIFVFSKPDIGSVDIGLSAHAEGGSYKNTESTEALGAFSHAEGRNTKAYGHYSHAEGRLSEAYGSAAHAEGQGTIASVAYSHAEGYKTTASEKYSHSEGVQTIADGEASHAEGSQTRAWSNYSHAEGYGGSCVGEAAHAEGYQTRAFGMYQHVQGKFNVIDKANKYAHIVGNGTSDADRTNAHTIDWEGNAWFAGEISGKNGNFEGDISAINGKFSGYVTDGSGNRLIDLDTALSNTAKYFGLGANTKLVVGDNTTDYPYDGSDISVSINRAIADLPDEGGEIILLNGEYKIHNPILINKSNVTLRGSNNTKLMHDNSDGEFNYINCINVDNITISNFNFGNINLLYMPSAYIYIEESRDINIFSNSSKISIENSAVRCVNSEDINIYNNKFESDLNAVSIQSSHKINIYNNHISASAHSIYIRNSTDSFIYNNMLIGGSEQFGIDSGTRINIKDNIIINKYNDHYASYLKCSNIIFSNNIFYQENPPENNEIVIILSGSNNIITNNNFTTYGLISVESGSTNNIISNNITGEEPPYSTEDP